VFQTDQARELARRLEVLKVRTNRSYETLSRRVGVSSSTLHRYCRGDVVPPTYDVVVRFCKVCGATREEAEDLLRCWSLATDRDRRPAPPWQRPVDGRWLAAALAVAGAVGGLVWRRRTR
jgi:transcriptional regulator with XRE-family HTH domain